MEAINTPAAIAKACGRKVCQCDPMTWERKGTDGDSELYCPKCEAYLSDLRVPDYLHDLNAAHEMENHVPTEYWYHLGKVLGLDFSRVMFTVEDMKLFGHATAAQRAEAFLKTLNLWKD